MPVSLSRVILLLLAVTVIAGGCRKATNDKATPAASQAAVATPAAKAPAALRLPIEQQGKWGYIDGTGKVALAPQYDQAEPLTAGAARVRQGAQWSLLDATLKAIPDVAYPELGDAAEGLVPMAALVTLAVPAEAAATSLEPIKEVPVRRWGWLDAQTGKIVIAPRFVAVGPFSAGLAAATEGTAWGYVDKTGKFVIPPQFSEARPFREGLAVVHQDKGGWGAIDATGKWVIPADCELLGDFHENLAVAFRLPSLAEGESMAAKLFATGTPGADPGTADDDKRRTLLRGNDGAGDAQPAGIGKGYIDRTGKQVIAPQFDEAHDFVDGLARVGVLVAPRGATPAAPGKAPKVALERRYGFIDRTGRFVISTDYAAAQDFSGGWAAVKGEAGWYYIDPTGKRQSDTDYEVAGPFRDGVAQVRRAGKLQYITTTGAVLWPKP